MGPTRRKAVTLLLAAMTALGLALTGVGIAVPAHAATQLAAPLPDRTYVLSSYYGPRCMPVAGSSTFHLGQDFGASRGTAIRAIAPGTVSRAGTVRGFGEWIVVDHVVNGERFSSLYAHLVNATKFVKKGQKVTRGQRIGDVGSSGTSTSPHLHMEIWKGGYPTGTAVDPLKFMKNRGVDLRSLSTRNYARTTPSSCKYFTTAKVNMRSGPGESYKVLRTPQPNVVIKGAPGAGSGDWRQVTRNGKSGWIHKNYLSPGYTSQGTRYVLPASLNMRAKPSASSKVKMSLPRNAKLTMLREIKGTWQRVRYNGKNGWVSARFISDTVGGAQVVPKASGNTYSWVDKKSLKLRKGPSTSSGAVMTLRRDNRVRHLAKMKNGWLKVKHGGKTGYVATKHLTSRKP
ncbi:SH3 domain-containing protein [Isoptericola croceus]|uniref:SH3 domain-containing protein n=1 Tax=Isoptericola croceus TaxID=3031406 RepID=UPI0023F87C65|nr:SH3 domain-containing protein [Isoptericola croceus]